MRENYIETEAEAPDNFLSFFDDVTQFSDYLLNVVDEKFLNQIKVERPYTP